MSFFKKEKIYVIAEIGLNHNGALDSAKELIDAAVASGVDAVKFQARSLEDIYTKKVLNDPLKAEHGTQYLLNEIKKAFLTFDDLAQLHKYTTEKHPQVDFFVTPFDQKSAEFLNSLNLKLFKLGSPDFCNLPLIKKVASFKKPLILSTGMSTEEEIIKVVTYLQSLSVDFALLHCNSTYPASIQDINLRYIDKLNDITKRVVGYSGHEQGFIPTLAAVSLGAKIIERHITFNRDSSGPDHRASLLPNEFKEMIDAIREVEVSIGINQKIVNQGESNNRLSLGKSLVYSKELRAGSILTDDDVISKTPAKGVSPLDLENYIGKKLQIDVAEEDYLAEEDFQIQTLKNEFTIPHTWGLVGRLNDFEEFLHLKPDLIEIHLTWRDLVDFNIDRFKLENKKYKQDLVVHAPEYYLDKLIDFTTNDKEIVDLSREMLSRTFDLARKLSVHFEGVNKNLGPRVVVHPGGHFKTLTNSNKGEQYRELQKNLSQMNTSGLRVLVENMPPYPWYFGGQWYNTIFLDPGEIAQFAKSIGWGVCYDLSHAQLYCNHANIKLSDFTNKIYNHISYLHVSDAAGTTQEGLQLGQGVMDYNHLFEVISKLDVGFIPEIWKGHLNKGEGFKKALYFIEDLLKKNSGKSCFDHGHAHDPTHSH